MVYRYLPQQSPISGGDLGVQQLDHFSLAWAIARHSKVGSSYPKCSKHKCFLFILLDVYPLNSRCRQDNVPSSVHVLVVAIQKVFVVQ